MTILNRTENHSNKNSLDKLRSIEYFIKKDEEGELEFKPTIYHENNDYVIKDGNTRSVAFYERRKKSNVDDISLPIYLIDNP